MSAWTSASNWCAQTLASEPSGGASQHLEQKLAGASKVHYRVLEPEVVGSREAFAVPRPARVRGHGSVGTGIDMQLRVAYRLSTCYRWLHIEMDEGRKA